MTREDFKIVQKYYATSSLVMIFLGDKIIESVEIYKNYKTFEDEASKKEREEEERGGKKVKKPTKMKTSKEKRSEQEINAECERLIKNYMSVTQSIFIVYDEVGQFPGQVPKEIYIAGIDPYKQDEESESFGAFVK